MCIHLEEETNDNPAACYYDNRPFSVLLSGILIVMKVICQYHIFIIFHVAFIQGTIDEEPFDVPDL